ncbi:MAG: hypothetical protein B6V02_02350 [Thermoprotei archaeon ex4572_64]|nr:MAG: hypothetical protein B6V02_02350 [Thermoprotei archaeon ex4572_64]
MSVCLFSDKYQELEVAYDVISDRIYIFKWFPRSLEEVVETLIHEVLHKVLAKIDLKLCFDEKLIETLTSLSVNTDETFRKNMLY